jgi:hypothetical protein
MTTLEGDHMTPSHGTSPVDRPMKATGTLVFGGVAAGYVGADIKLEDGSQWRFHGAVLGIGIGISYSHEATGVITGFSHMEGACSVSVAGAAAGKGTLNVIWEDSHGQIGVMTCAMPKGASAEVASGAGGWGRG